MNISVRFLLILISLIAFSQAKTICEKSPEFLRPALCSAFSRQLLNRFSWLKSEQPIKPPFSADHFATFDAQKLKSLTDEDLQRIPENYFTRLSSQQVSKLSADFFNRLRNDQAATLLDSFKDQLSPESQKLLLKLKNQLSPQARAIITILAAITAALIYRLGL